VAMAITVILCMGEVLKEAPRGADV
jgi:hypothetical protein